MSPPPRREVTLLSAAKADLQRLHADDPALAKLALLKLADLRAGRLTGAPLAELARTGDLADCAKLYFGTGSNPTHRIVYRTVPGHPRRVEVVEVVAVEAREELYVYLLTAVRLGRLPVESRPQFNRVHQAVIARRGHGAPTGRPPRRA